MVVQESATDDFGHVRLGGIGARLAEAIERVGHFATELLEAARGQAARSHKTLALSAPAGPAITAVLERGGFLTDPSPEFRDFWCHGDHSR